MRNTNYITPKTTALNIGTAEILMSSNSGRRLSTNLGLDLSTQALDPREAW